MANTTRCYQRGKIDLSASAVTTCTTPGQYYPILGTFVIRTCCGFTTDVIGNVTPKAGMNATIVGTSALTANKNCNIVYCLFEDGAATSYTTNAGLSNGKGDVIAISREGWLTAGLAHRVYVKSDVADTELTISGLSVVIRS